MKYIFLAIYLPTVCLATGKTHEDWRKFQDDIDRINSQESAQELSGTEAISIATILDRRMKEIEILIKDSDLQQESVNKSIKKYSNEFNGVLDEIDHIKELSSPKETLEFILENFNTISESLKYLVNQDLKPYLSVNRKIYKKLNEFTELASKLAVDDDNKKAYDKLAKQSGEILDTAKKRYNFAKDSIAYYSNKINTTIAEILTNSEITNDFPIGNAIETMLISQSAEIKPIEFSEKRETESFLFNAAQQVTAQTPSETSETSKESPKLAQSALKPKNDKPKDKPKVIASKQPIISTWRISMTNKIKKNLDSELDNRQRMEFNDLAGYLRHHGPKIHSQDLLVGRFRNYGALAKDLYHCHLGTSQKVAVWKADEKAKQIIFYYVGKHPGDQYKQIKSRK